MRQTGRDMFYFDAYKTEFGYSLVEVSTGLPLTRNGEVLYFRTLGASDAYLFQQGINGDIRNVIDELAQRRVRDMANSKPRYSMNMVKLYRLIEVQAGLPDMVWRARPRQDWPPHKTAKWLISRKALVETYLSNLQQWAGRTKPEGEILEVARSFYRQGKLELEYIDQLRRTWERWSEAKKGGE